MDNITSYLNHHDIMKGKLCIHVCNPWALITNKTAEHILMGFVLTTKAFL
jgi:hypothetical protein